MNIRCLLGHDKQLMWLARTDAKLHNMDRLTKTYTCRRPNCDYAKAKVIYVTKPMERIEHET